MSEQKHTPTPWREGPRGPNNMPVVGAQSLMLAHICTGEGFQEQADANAAFIVKAVNSHDALVAALRKLHAECVEAGFTERDKYGWPEALKGAVDALAALEAK